MSIEYDNYLFDHCGNVAEAFYWIESNIPEVLDDVDMPPAWFYDLREYHDDSKWSNEEYDAYDNFFYGNRSHKVVNDFDYAWLHHIRNNPHHWQHWVLIEDDTGRPKALEMPLHYVIEMICDWWSFSFKKGDLREVFKWYDDHKDKMILHPSTRKRVEEILDAIDKKLKENEEFQNEEDDDQKDELAHEGVKGMQWGVRHGPPYPLDPDVNRQIRMNAKHGFTDEEPTNTRAEKEKIRKDNEEEHPVEKLEDLKKLNSDADMDKVLLTANHPDPDDRKHLGRVFNCPNCASAYEMIRRGYDVVAREAPNGSNVGSIEKNFKGGKLESLTKSFDKDPDALYLTKENYDAHRDPFWGHRQMLYDKVEKQVVGSLTSQGEGARGIVVTGWVRGLGGNIDDLDRRTSGFHAFNYEVKGGKAVFYDVQGAGRINHKGTTNTDWIWGSDYRDIYAMRTDNLEPSEEICKAVYSNRKKGE